MNGYHWFFSIRVCTCGGDASRWRLCVLTAALRSWCMSLEGFLPMKARVKSVLCCVHLSCPNIAREMVSRKAILCRCLLFPSLPCLLLPAASCPNPLLWWTFLARGCPWILAEHTEGQTLDYFTVENTHLLEKELKFLIIPSLWLRFGWKESNLACVCMYVCMCS